MSALRSFNVPGLPGLELTRRPPRTPFHEFRDRLTRVLRLDPDSRGETPETLVQGLAFASEGYEATWRQLVFYVERLRERAEERLAFPHDRAEVGALLTYLRSRLPKKRRPRDRKVVVGGARDILGHMGLQVQGHLIERAFRLACSLAMGKDLEAVQPQDIRTYLQRLYDEQGNARAALDAVIHRLEAAERDHPDYHPFISRLHKVQKRTAAHALSKRGVHLRPKAEVAAKTQFKRGDSAGSRGARIEQFQYLARLSPMRLEEEQIRNYETRCRYGGHRQDIADKNGHHPYFTSIHHANWARHLETQGIPWIYRPQAFYLEVPEGETRISERAVLFEPHFYLPEKRVYVVILRACHQGKKRERQEAANHRLAVIRNLLPSLTIETVPLRQAEQLMTIGSNRDHQYRMETLFESYHDPGDRKTHTRPGNNVSTNPDRFLMEECPCRVCIQNRKDPRKK